MGKGKRQVKFEARHLKSAIKHRKDVQKLKRHKRTAEEALATKRVEHEVKAKARAEEAAELARVEEMEGSDVDDSDASSGASDGEGSESDVDLDELAGLDSDDEGEEGAAEEPARKGKNEGKGEGKAADYEDVAGSGDEDEGEDEGASPALKGAVAKHRADLEKLKTSDPAFYKYLQETDSGLLNFGEGDAEADEGGEDLLASSDEEEGPGAGEEVEMEESSPADLADSSAPGMAELNSLSKHGTKTLTMATVSAWTKAAAAERPSASAMRNVLRAYRAACHYGDSEESIEQTMRISSAAAFNAVILFTLKEADRIFRALLGAEGKALTATAIAKLPRWKAVEPLCKSYLGNTVHLLGSMTDNDMRAYIFRRLRASAAFAATAPRLARHLVKSALETFGSSAAGTSAARVQAVLLARAIARETRGELLEAVLKGSYRAHAAVARASGSTPAAAAELDFMRAAVVELFADDGAASYPIAFNFVRAIAVSLRDATHVHAAGAKGGRKGEKSRGSSGQAGPLAATKASKAVRKDATRDVLGWQTVASLELFVDVCAAAPEHPDLRLLAYPVSQLLFGVARLRPSPSYFPLRLRCARALQRLGAAVGAHVPVAPLLLEILAWPELTRRAPRQGGRKGEGDSPDPNRALRASSSALADPAWREELALSTIDALSAWIAAAGRHVAFPELARLPITSLRRFARGQVPEQVRRAARTLADGAERNATWVAQARERADFAPRDAERVASFLKDVAGQSPIERVDAVLRERAARRAAQRRQEEVVVPVDDEVAEPEGEAAVLPAPEQAREAARRRAREARDPKAKAAKAAKPEEAGGEDEESDEEEGNPDAEDVVGAFELSDSDEESDEDEEDGNDDDDDDE